MASLYVGVRTEEERSANEEWVRNSISLATDARFGSVVREYKRLLREIQTTPIGSFIKVTEDKYPLIVRGEYLANYWSNLKEEGTAIGGSLYSRMEAFDKLSELGISPGKAIDVLEEGNPDYQDPKTSIIPYKGKISLV